MFTCDHTHEHTYLHISTHIYACSLLTYLSVHMHTWILGHLDTWTPGHTHSQYTLALMPKHACAFAYIPAHVRHTSEHTTHSLILLHICTPSHTCTSTHVHTCTCTYIFILTCMYAHTTLTLLYSFTSSLK